MIPTSRPWMRDEPCLCLNVHEFNKLVGIGWQCPDDELARVAVAYTGHWRSELPDGIVALPSVDLPGFRYRVSIHINSWHGTAQAWCFGASRLPMDYAGWHHFPARQYRLGDLREVVRQMYRVDLMRAMAESGTVTAQAPAYVTLIDDRHLVELDYSAQELLVRYDTYEWSLRTDPTHIQPTFSVWLGESKYEQPSRLPAVRVQCEQCYVTWVVGWRGEEWEAEERDHEVAWIYAEGICADKAARHRGISVRPRMAREIAAHACEDNRIERVRRQREPAGLEFGSAIELWAVEPHRAYPKRRRARSSRRRS